MTTGPRIGLRRQGGDGTEGTAAGRTTFELIAVVLLGVATIATAWCGYQSARWNDRETDEARAGGLARLEASREYGLAAQKVSYDANITSQLATAVAADDEELADFILSALVRPDFLPYLQEWKAQADAGTATNLFENEEYLEAQFAESQANDAEADAALQLSQEASENAAEYLIMTLLTATALFFAGVTSSFASRSAKTILIAVAAALLVYTLARITTLPVV